MDNREHTSIMGIDLNCQNPEESASVNQKDICIERIETIPVLAPLPKEFRGSYYRMTQRATLITRVHTVGGAIGEAYVADEDKSLLEIEKIVREEITPRVVGLNILATEQVWQRGYPATFDILRDRRLGLVALAAVDTAVWDGVGKILQQPLWRLWGGFRDRVPLICIGGYYGEVLGTIEDEIGYYKHELGLAGVKFKVGGLSPSEDAKRVIRAREAAGSDWIIAIDANQAYSVEDAIALEKLLVDLDIRWFEEPVQWHNDRRALRDVRLKGTIPVCAGQSELSSSGCRDLMEAGGIDVCNFDASWSGGPTAWRRTAAIAMAYDIQMAHHEEPQVASHLIASQPHGTVVECFHPERDPFWWNLIVTERRLEDGKLILPEKSGLGWELDNEYISRYQVR